MFMGRPKLYEAAAEQVIKQIQGGRFLPGQRLPSIRELSQRLSRSIATVQEMYLLLERRGWVEARPRSGYFVANPLPDHQPRVELPQGQFRPCTVSQWRLSLNSTSHNPGNLPHLFGRASPDLTLPTLTPLKRLLADMTRASSSMALGYGALQGVDELRIQIARRMIEAGCKLTSEDILITASCQEALACALRAVTQPGDIVAIESPTYYGIIQALEAMNLKALEIPSDPVTGMSLHALELALEQWPIKACIVTPNFGNPLGGFMPKKNKQRVIELAQLHDTIIIEDDIYSDLDYRPGRPGTIKAYDEDGRVILISSFSKILAPGLSVGWIVPGRYFAEVEQQKYITSLTTPVLPQLALARFLSSGAYDVHLRKGKRLYSERKDRVIQQIRQSFPAGTQTTCPQGGILLWIQLPQQVDAMQLSKQALDHGISIAPGDLFSLSSKYRNYVRICFAAVNSELDYLAISTLGELATQSLKENQLEFA